ncbi:hypothetical protein BJ973_006944 [Actinoplanes tereljensis]|uniref:ArnT-like N-terminal domain-containing protein n=1 Tax=Paractinoplanes tereljensis TaxID=571912 RepID=A0A919NLP5_9ACTN|nr:phospholipid carrier-dependent glycosyltransferase [Actinoplanes tereljensis]GIF19902.1 hypothetical protein Ate02nite_26320 [Actinoplanes tereljensis]
MPAALRPRALLRHLPLLVVLAGAVGLRVWYALTYPYAFFFPDSRPYMEAAYLSTPNPARPYGYSWLLKPFLHGPYDRIAFAQHLLGVVLVVVGYVFLVRRGAKPWLAALAVLPFAVDARVLTIEHFVLAETAYITLTAGGLFLLAWRRRLGWLAAALAGTMLGFAAVTRSVGLPILALAVVYLVIRRVGWLRLVAFALPVAGFLGGYLTWYHQSTDVYAFGQYSGRFLYARVMPIADCDKLKLTADQRELCMPDAPATWVQRPDNYIWSSLSPARRLYPSETSDKVLGDFANTVIKQRPGAYAAMVAEQSWWHLTWRPPLNSDAECLATIWLPPAKVGTDCVARYYTPASRPDRMPPPHFLVDNPDASRLAAYGKVVTTPGPLYAVGILAAVVAACWRPRRRPWREAADALLFTGAGFGLLVVSVATSLFDYRYAEPAVLLIPIGLALSVTRIAAVSGKPLPPIPKQRSAEPDLQPEPQPPARSEPPPPATTEPQPAKAMADPGPEPEKQAEPEALAQAEGDAQAEAGAAPAVELGAADEAEPDDAGADDLADLPVYEIPSQAKADDRVIRGVKPRGALSH